jgi:hypothetical protein
LEEAKFFQISRLEKWLKNRGYLETVKIKYSANMVDGNFCTKTLATDEQADYYPFFSVLRFYGKEVIPACCAVLCGGLLGGSWGDCSLEGLSNSQGLGSPWDSSLLQAIGGREHDIWYSHKSPQLPSVPSFISWLFLHS